MLSTPPREFSKASLDDLASHSTNIRNNFQPLLGNSLKLPAIT